DKVSGSKTRRTLAVAKHAMMGHPPGLEFEIIDANGQGVVKWGRSVDLDAEELAADQGDAGERGASADAEQLLRDMLGGGKWVSSRAIKTAAEQSMISPKTLRNTRERMGVECRSVSTDAGHGTEWRLRKGK